MKDKDIKSELESLRVTFFCGMGSRVIYKGEIYYIKYCDLEKAKSLGATPVSLSFYD